MDWSTFMEPVALRCLEGLVTTVGKVVLGMMGRLRPKPATGDSASTIG